MRLTSFVSVLVLTAGFSGAALATSAPPACGQEARQTAGEQTGVDNGALPRNTAGVEKGTERRKEASLQMFDKNDHTRGADAGDREASNGAAPCP